MEPHGHSKISQAYQPVAFVYTGTIGGSKDSSSTPKITTYIEKYKDVIIPKPISQRQLMYLYHVAPIYNWLRGLEPGCCYQREQLGRYIKQNHHKKGEDLCSVKNIKQGLWEYAEKWEVAKFCLKSKVLVKGAGDVQGSHLLCRHCIKSQLWSQFYSYDFRKGELVVDKYYCKDCQGIVKADLSIVQPAWAPIFDTSYGQQIRIKNKSYLLSQVFTEAQTFIRTAHKIWYRIDAGKGAALSGSGPPCIKNAKCLFAYIRSEMFEDCGLMKCAEGLSAYKRSKQPIQSKMEEDFPEKKNKINPKKENMEKVMQGTPQNNNEEPLQALEKETPAGFGELKSQYKQEIQKLYIRPKEKDEYQKDYDKGKTKKIKKKTEYLKPDFNKIFQSVKEEAQKQPDPELEERGSWRRDKYPHKRQRQKGRDGPNPGIQDRGRCFKKKRGGRRDQREKFDKKWEQI